MSDNLKIPGPEDAQKINLSEPYEVRYWCTRLNVDEFTLRLAVRAAGPLVKNVRRYLNR